MQLLLQHADGALNNVAGLFFVVGYLVGLYAALRCGKSTLWPAIAVSLVCCLVRGFSEPLGVAAIASVSVLHVGIGCLTVLLLKYTKPLSASN